MLHQTSLLYVWIKFQNIYFRENTILISDYWPYLSRISSYLLYFVYWDQNFSILSQFQMITFYTMFYILFHVLQYFVELEMHSIHHFLTPQ